jgi:hypothetical protein
MAPDGNEINSLISIDGNGHDTTWKNVTKFIKR